MDPDQTAPILFVGKASKTFQQTTEADKFCCDWCFNPFPPVTTFVICTHLLFVLILNNINPDQGAI